VSTLRITRAGAIRMCVALTGVKPATVRVWIHRGLITEHPDGFDPDEVWMWTQQTRNIEQAVGAVHAAHVRTTRRAS
jgi:hypothetical protein